MDVCVQGELLTEKAQRVQRLQELLLLLPEGFHWSRRMYIPSKRNIQSFSDHFLLFPHKCNYIIGGLQWRDLVLATETYAKYYGERTAPANS